MESEIFEWRFGHFLQDQAPQALWDDFAVVILNQPLRDITTLRRLWKNSSLRVAADGGANRVLEASRQASKDPAVREFNNLDVIIGDLDSVEESTTAHFLSLAKPPSLILNPDQDSTDFSKAVSYVRQQKPSIDIVAMGSLGGRVDQGLSQLHHLYLFQDGPGYEKGRMFLVSSESLTFLLKAGKHRIWVREGEHGGDGGGAGSGGGGDMFGKHVGIIPVKEPCVVSTRGLEWDVTDWKTEFGGQMSTSNHVLPETKYVEVETDKDVVFTIALR